MMVSTIGARGSIPREDFESKIQPSAPDHARDARAQRRRVVDMATGEVSSVTNRLDYAVAAADYFSAYEEMVFEEVVSVNLKARRSS